MVVISHLRFNGNNESYIVSYNISSRCFVVVNYRLPFPDVNIYVDNNGRVNVSLGKSDTPARTFISEMMILANSQAAKYVSDRMIPGLFRSQGQIKRRLVHGEDDDLFQNTLQRKNLPRGELSIEAKPHSGLGVSYYTTVTSPIRRLLDLVMQHQINNLVDNHLHQTTPPPSFYQKPQ